MTDARPPIGPERLRAYVTLLMRDILIPGAGVGLALFPPGGHLEPYMLPLVAGMIGIPLVAPRGGS